MVQRAKVAALLRRAMLRRPESRIQPAKVSAPCEWPARRRPKEHEWQGGLRGHPFCRSWDGCKECGPLRLIAGYPNVAAVNLHRPLGLRQSDSHTVNELTNMASVDCNRTHRDFFLASFIMRSSTFAVRHANKPKSELLSYRSQTLQMVPQKVCGRLRCIYPAAYRDGLRSTAVLSIISLLKLA